MIFEYDENKSVANKAKHGLDFMQAQRLWKDENLFIAPLQYINESRFIAIGQIERKHYTAIFT